MTTRKRSITPRNTQRGASLLEVLITILILSFGLLGIAGLTVSSLQAAKMAQFQSVALQLANDYADRMRGNAPGVDAGNYNMTEAYTGSSDSVDVPTCAATECTAAELAALDRAQWTNSLRQRLPAGSAFVRRAAGADLGVDMWLIWSEPGLKYDPDNAISSSGGSQCPAEALAGFTQPATCVYYRISI